jgi:hypothetical protein
MAEVYRDFSVARDSSTNGPAGYAAVAPGHQTYGGGSNESVLANEQYTYVEDTIRNPHGLQPNENAEADPSVQFTSEARPLKTVRGMAAGRSRRTKRMLPHDMPARHAVRTILLHKHS